MSKHHTTWNHRALVLIAALAAVVALPATAATLRVSTERNAVATPANAAAGEFAFTVGNDSSGELGSLRIVADRAHAATCASTTVQGQAFSTGALGAGDSVRCVVRPLTQARGRNASIAILGRDANGQALSRTFSLAQPAALTPAQGIVVVSAGGIYANTANDGVLHAGDTVTYTYDLLNLGTLALSGLQLSDVDGVEACAQTALAVGASATCTHIHTITAAEATAGMVFNQVDVSGTDANSGAVQADDFVVTQNLGGNAGIRVFKSPLLYNDADNSGYASVGDVVQYTFVVRNDNQQVLNSVNLTEPDPTKIDGSITCNSTTLGGQSFAGLGSGVLQSNDIVLCTATHTITAADASAGSADNLADVAAQPLIGGPVNGSGASAVTIPTPANVTVTKALTGESGSQPGVAEPGETLTYTITLSNSGGASAFNVGVTDPLDPNVTFVSASNGGALSGSTVAWSGLTVPGNGSLSLTVAVTVANPIPSGVTQIANLAYVSGTTPPDCAATPLPKGCVITPTPGAIRLAKKLTAESGTQPGIAEPGETLTYTITLTNIGGSAVTGYGVSDPLDPNVSFVSADNGGADAGGIVSWTNLTIPAGASLALNVSVKVANPLPLSATNVTNLVYQTGTTPPDCSTVPLPATCVVTPTALPPRLQVTKTVASPTVAPNGTATYTITVINVGTVTADNVVVSDPIPTGIQAFTSWSCSATGGAACANAQGSGAIAETIPTFPAGGQLVYTVSAQVAPNTTGSVLNSVSVTPAANTFCMPGQTQGPCGASASVTVAQPKPVEPVPATSPLAMLLMALALMAAAWHRRERRTR